MGEWVWCVINGVLCVDVCVCICMCEIVSVSKSMDICDLKEKGVEE